MNIIIIPRREFYVVATSSKPDNRTKAASGFLLLSVYVFCRCVWVWPCKHRYYYSRYDRKHCAFKKLVNTSNTTTVFSRLHWITDRPQNGTAVRNICRSRINTHLAIRYVRGLFRESIQYFCKLTNHVVTPPTSFRWFNDCITAMHCASSCV